MDSNSVFEKVEVPKPNSWPGTFEAFKLVRPNIKLQIWNFVGVIGIGIIISLVVDIILAAIFKNSITGGLINDLIGLVLGGLLEATIISMYFACLVSKEMPIKEAFSYGYNRMLKMTGLIIIMYVVLLVSFVLLIIPFFFILPRVYLAPYFLIYNESTVSEALAASWHLTKGHFQEVYEILLLQVGLALICLTIIGIPFAVYWGIINSSSFALLTMYLSQGSKSSKKLKSS